MLRAVVERVSLVLAAFCLGMAAAPYVLDEAAFGEAPAVAANESPRAAANCRTWRAPMPGKEPPALVIDIKSRHAIFSYLTDGAGDWMLITPGGPHGIWREATALDRVRYLRTRRQPYANWTAPAGMAVETNEYGEWLFYNERAR